MRWKRNSRYLFQLMVLAAVLTGCGNEKKPVLQNQPNPEHIYEEVDESIIIDADVICPEEGVVPKIYEAEQIEITKENIHKFLELCDDGVETVTVDREMDNRYSYYFQSRKGRKTMMNMGREIDIWHCSFAYNDTEKMQRYLPIFGYTRSRDGYAGSGNVSRFKQPKKFSFATVEEAESVVYEALRVLIPGEIRLQNTYYLNHDTLQQCEQEIQEELGEDFEKIMTYTPKEWTPADDCYMFSYCCAVDGIFLVESSQERLTYYQQACHIEVYYTAEGITAVYAGGPWKAAGVEEEPKAIMSAKEAMETVKDKLESIYSAQVREVQEIALRYYPIQDKKRWLLIPVWEALICKKDVPLDYLNEITDEYSYVLVDARTGEEL